MMSKKVVLTSVTVTTSEYITLTINHTKEPGDFYFKISTMLSITIANNDLVYSNFLHTHFEARFFNSSCCHCLVFTSVLSSFPFGPL